MLSLNKYTVFHILRFCEIEDLMKFSATCRDVSAICRQFCERDNLITIGINPGRLPGIYLAPLNLPLFDPGPLPKQFIKHNYVTFLCRFLCMHDIDNPILALFE